VRTTPSSLRAVALAAALPLVLAAGCGSADDDGDDATAAPTSEAAPTSSAPTEVGASSPRLALTYEGGIQILDATTLEVLTDEELDGFNRLNAAGDGRHFLVSTTGGFRLLDGGAWAEPHGDHSHYYTSDPALTDIVFSADTPGHVVAHAGHTVLFDDGTGDVTVLESAELADGDDAEVGSFSTPEAHHGVAVQLEDGTMLVSDGTEDERSGVRILDADGEELAARDDCPSVHGETVAAGEAVVIGCEDGAVLYTGGELRKIQSPDAYGRIGNQFGTEDSPIVLGDYERSAEDRSSTVALIDTTTASMQLVDLPAPYWYRSFGRGPNGEGLVLTYDGNLQVIDPVSGAITTSIPVTGTWEESEDWQDAHPQVVVVDGMAYVTDPGAQKIHAVDVEAGTVWKSADLEVTPIELAGVSGDVEEHAEHEHEGEHGDDHEGEQAE